MQALLHPRRSDLYMLTVIQDALEFCQKWANSFCPRNVDCATGTSDFLSGIRISDVAGLLNITGCSRFCTNGTELDEARRLVADLVAYASLVAYIPRCSVQSSGLSLLLFSSFRSRCADILLTGSVCYRSRRSAAQCSPAVVSCPRCIAE